MRKKCSFARLTFQRGSVLNVTFLVAVGYMAEGASITGLGYLADRSAATYATAISGDGLVVVGYVEEVANNYQGRRAFRWTRSGGMQDLGVLTNASAASDQSMAFGVSGDGAVVGGESNYEGFRWTTTNGLSGLGYVQDDDTGSGIRAVSADGGTLVGYGFKNSFFRAVVWSEGQGLVPLGVGSALDLGSSVEAISSDGTTFIGGSGSFGFQWSQGNGLISLGDLSRCTNFHDSRAYAVSANGSVVVGTSYPRDGSCLVFDENFDAFRWTAAEGMKPLDRLHNQHWTEALAVSADAGVIGGDTYLPGEGDVALLWNQRGEVFRLWDVLAGQGADLGHWVALRGVTGVSADGRTVAGSGLNTDMKIEAFTASFEGARSLIGLVAGRAAAAGQIEIRWSADITNCVIEARSQADGTSAWQTLTNTPTANGGEWVVTLDLDRSSRLFRLRCP